MEKPNESPKRRSSRKDSLERFELWRQICWLQLIWIVQIDEIGLFFCSETCANLHITTQVESFANMQVQGGMSSMSMSWMCTINLWHQNRHLKSINPPKCRSSDSKSTKIGPGRPQKPQDDQRIRMVIPSSGFPWRSPAGCSTNGYLGGLCWWLKNLCLVGIPFGAEIPMQKPPNLNHQPIVCWNGLWSLIWR